MDAYDVRSGAPWGSDWLWCRLVVSGLIELHTRPRAPLDHTQAIL